MSRRAATATSSGVYVEVPDPDEDGHDSYAWLDLGVAVPAGIPVSLVDSSGDMTIDDVQVVKITDSSGDIVARKLPADVEIGDSSGDVRVEDAAGRVQVTDSSGDIVVRGAREVVIPTDSSGSIEISRVTGDVRIDNDSSGRRVGRRHRRGLRSWSPTRAATCRCPM